MTLAPALTAWQRLPVLAGVRALGARVGLAPIRYVAAGYVVATFGMDASLALVGGSWMALEYAVAGVALVVMLFRPGLGAVLGLPALVLPLPVGPTGADLPLLMAVGLLVPSAVPRVRPALLAPYAAFLVAMGVLNGPQVATVYATCALVSVGLGLLVGRLRAASERRRARASAMSRLDAVGRRADRERLASELQRVVQASLTAIDQASSSAGVRDLDQALEDAGRAAREALVDVRSLVEVLRQQRGVPSASTARPSATGRAAATVAVVAVVFVVLRSAADASLIAGVLCCLASLAVLWRVRGGLGLAGAALGCALLFPPPFVAPLATLAALSAAASENVGRRPIIWIGQALFVAGWLLRQPDAAFTDGWTAVTVCVVAWIVAAGSARFADERGRELELLQALEHRRAESRRLERERLARDLHDVVARHLSLVSLQVLAHGGSEDAGELEDALAACAAASRIARQELDALVAALTDDDPSGPTGSAAATLSPTTAAEELASTLRHRGHPVTCRVELVDNALPSDVRLTIVRILQEAGTNALRYAARGGRCAITLRLADGVVDLRVASELAPVASTFELSTNWGLKGLTERAQLAGGRLSAGPNGGEWVVSAVLPVRSAANA